jgi:hypothetical protein
MRSTPYAIVRRGLYGLWNMDRMPDWHLSHGIIRHAPDEMRAGLVDMASIEKISIAMFDRHGYVVVL